MPLGRPRDAGFEVHFTFPNPGDTFAHTPRATTPYFLLFTMATNPSAASRAEIVLTSLLNKNLHVHISDGRMFVGQLKCTDNERNVILAMTHEYRQPSQNDIARAAAEHERMGKAGKVKVEMKKRFVGLVVVPGWCIEKIEAEGWKGE